MKTLERSLGLWSVFAISTSAMIGSGIFVLPGLAVAQTGPSAWLAYLLAGLTVLPAALSKSELATAMPESGGTYVYVDRAFGPLAGCIAGFGLWASLLLKSAFALMGFGAYLGAIWQLDLQTTALSLLGIILVLNVLGAKKVGQVQIVVVGISLVGLLLIVAGSLPDFSIQRFDHSFTGGASGFLGATALVFVSYAGVTNVAAVAEEVKNPGKNLPAGMLLSLFVVGILYALVALVLVGVLPLDELKQDQHPIYTLGKQAFGPALGIVAAVLGVLTMTSMANSGILASSRFPFAMSRNDLLPPLFTSLHPKFRTPYVCIGLTGAVIVLAIMFLDIAKMAKLASSVMLLLFILENLAVLVLRESGVQWYKPVYRARFYPWTQVFGSLSGLGLLVMLGWISLIAVGGVLFLGGLLFFAYGRKRTARRGELGKLGVRQDLLIQESGESQSLLDATDAGAEIVVSLFGRERSPEMLVQIGVCLSEGHLVEVVHLTSLPEQTILAADLEDDLKVNSVRRRTKAMAEIEGIDLRFDEVVSHDNSATLHRISQRLHCRWLVLEWRGFKFYNPLGWLMNHLSCNLALFKDAGIRYIRKIRVYTEPGPHDALVASTADHLANSYGASLSFVCVLPDEDRSPFGHPQVDYIDQLKQLCRAQTETIILQGKSDLEALPALTVDYDLLVMDTAAQHPLKSMVLRTRKDRIAEHSACSVLLLRTPRRSTHEAFDPRKVSAAASEFSLLDYLADAVVEVKLGLKGKDACFAYFAKELAKLIDVVGKQEILDSLNRRERTQNTSVGKGLAMPHGTLAALQRSYVGIFTSREPLDYDAVDGEPVDIFFVTLGPPSDRQVHLLLLSGLSKMVLESDLLQKLRDCESSGEVEQAFGESSREIEKA